MNFYGFALALLLIPFHISISKAQGTLTEFGKNRVQYHDFIWSFYTSENFVTYFYLGGQDVGRFTVKIAEKEIKDIKDLVERFTILDFSIKCAEEAGKQKARLENQGLMIDRGDLFIGVIALKNDLPLKTNNQKHFDRIEGLELI